MAEPRKVVSCFSHVPMVRLPEGVDEAPLCGGILARVPFQLWARLDRGASAHEDGFRKTAPVFFRADFGETDEVGPGETLRWAWEEFDRDLYTLYVLLLLTTMARLPEPDLSKQYYFDPDLGSLTPRDAVLGYEAVAYAYTADPLVLSTSLLDSLEDRAASLREAGWLFALPEIGYVRDVLFTVSRPEFSSRDDVVFCTTALEALLVPEPTRGVTRAFSRRGGALLSTGFAGREAVARLFGALYDLRSRLVHGDDPSASAAALAEMLPSVPPAVVPRYLLCNSLWKIFRLAGADRAAFESIPAFARRLDAAYTDSGAYEALGLASP